MNGALIASIVGIVGALILASRGMSSRIAPAARWKMAAVWLVIILGVVLVINMLGLDRQQ